MYCITERIVRSTIPSSGSGSIVASRVMPIQSWQVNTERNAILNTRKTKTQWNDADWLTESETEWTCEVKMHAWLELEIE